MYLITTADRQFWKTDVEVLLLGEWCKLFSQRSILEKIDYRVIPYFWNYREELYKDFLCIQNIYKKILIEVTKTLNEINSVDYSIRYWKIIIGPWLFTFIQILYERYFSIKSAVGYHKNLFTLISEDTSSQWLPNDYSSFLNASTTDSYNNYLYSRIIEDSKYIRYKIVGNNENINNCKSKQYFSLKLLAKLIAIISGKMIVKFAPSKFNRIVFISSGLAPLSQLKLQISMGQIPFIWAPNQKIPKFRIDPSKREKFDIPTKGKYGFEAFLSKMLKKQIPLAYLEGYETMKKISFKTFPVNPEIIFTANAHYSNELFKFWAARQVENGAILIISQHGGHYGSGLWSSADLHEIEISDQFLSWGWSCKETDKVVPLSSGILSEKKKKVSYKKRNRNILWVTMSLPRYSYWMYSVPVGPQLLKYIEDQYKFSEAVLPEVHERLLLRLYPSDFGWNESERWAEFDPTLRIYVGNKSIAEQLNESCLFIGTYNATTFLEALSADFPSVLFWDPKYWELSNSAQPYYNILRETGILHDTPESAAKHVNRIYIDPYSWWNQPEVQKAKNIFCKNFAKTNKNWLKEWKKYFTRLMI